MDVLHLIPFLIVTLIYFPFLAQTGAEKLAAIVNFGYNESKQFLWIVGLIRWSYVLQLIAYPIIIYQQIFKCIKQPTHPINPARHRQFKWLLLLNSLFLIYGGLMLLYFLLVDWNIGGIEKDFYISAIMCFAIYSISYVGMMNPDLLNDVTFINKIKVSKYAHSRIRETEAHRIIGLLEFQMKQQQLFLNHDLNLQQVATTLQISRHLISQALNSILNKSFHQYVNEYRITHAIHLLRTKKAGHNLKTIMYASGFNNRASFNNNFKKLTGMTATEFLKKEMIG